MGMNYILVVDDEADIRDIYEMILSRAFPLDIVSAESGKKALEIIKERGHPEIIISDLNMPNGDGVFLHQQLIEHNIDVPFVICSTDSPAVLKKRFPDIYGFIEKPKIIQPTIDMVESVLSDTRTANPPYVPIRISLLLRWGSGNADLFMKLSETKYVKVINAGEAFIPADAERFSGKGLTHLYITSDAADHFLEIFQKNMNLVIESESHSSEISVLSLESLENIERIASFLGWTPHVINAAKKAVTMAVKAASSQPNILKLLKQKSRDPSSNYSKHVSMQALLCCGFCHQLGWTSDSAQLKLGLAALMHDITVDENAYNDIFLWNQAASGNHDKTPEVIKYRNHPSDAANLLLTIKDLPPDVDQIILQHHENKDGGGFPRGLISSRISPMASLFIIVEDLINFMEDSEDIEGKISQFVKHRDGKYNSGNFKKVFDVVKDNVEKSRQLT